VTFGNEEGWEKLCVKSVRSHAKVFHVFVPDVDGATAENVTVTDRPGASALAELVARSTTPSGFE
jgi:hypothetical protein